MPLYGKLFLLITIAAFVVYASEEEDDSFSSFSLTDNDVDHYDLYQDDEGNE